MEKISAMSCNRNGFTLVEMMVALFIFAMLSVAGVVMLRSAVDSDAAVRVISMARPDPTLNGSNIG